MSFDYPTADHPNNFYARVRFIHENGLIVFRPTLLNKIVGRIANHFATAYENRWAWIFPVCFIWVSLRVDKRTVDSTSSGAAGC